MFSSEGTAALVWHLPLSGKEPSHSWTRLQGSAGTRKMRGDRVRGLGGEAGPSALCARCVTYLRRAEQGRRTLESGKWDKYALGHLSVLVLWARVQAWWPRLSPKSSHSGHVGCAGPMEEPKGLCCLAGHPILPACGPHLSHWSNPHVAIPIRCPSLSPCPLTSLPGSFQLRGPSGGRCLIHSTGSPSASTACGLHGVVNSQGWGHGRHPPAAQLGALKSLLAEGVKRDSRMAGGQTCQARAPSPEKCCRAATSDRTLSCYTFSSQLQMEPWGQWEHTAPSTSGNSVTCILTSLQCSHFDRDGDAGPTCFLGNPSGVRCTASVQGWTWPQRSCIWSFAIKCWKRSFWKHKRVMREQIGCPVLCSLDI